MSVKSLEAAAVALGATRLPSTVLTEFNRLKSYCTAMGLSHPANSELHGLRLIMRGQHKRAWRSVKRATPLRAKHLIHFTRRHCASKDTASVQLAAMLWLGHSALLRAQELLKLRWSDIEFADFGLRIRVRPELNKTSVGGPPDYVLVPREGSEAHHWLRLWSSQVTTRQDDADSLVWGSFSYSKWLQQIKEIGKEVGLPGVTTHSLRAGGCTDLLEGGAPHELVKRLGRWRSECFLQYWRPDPAELTAHLGAAFGAAARRLAAFDDPVLAAGGEGWKNQRATAKRAELIRRRVKWRLA